MSRSGKVSRTFEFLCVFGAAEKNKEKVEGKVVILQKKTVAWLWQNLNTRP